MRGKKMSIEDVRIMERLRSEEKLSNREIAERMDISYFTVHRLLGPQGFRSPNREKPIPKEPEKKSAKPSCALPIVRRRVTLKGLALTFELDTEDNMCFIQSNSPSLQFEASVPSKLLEQLGMELIEASKF